MIPRMERNDGVMARLDRVVGPILIVGGGLALPLALFLPWFEPGFCPPGQACIQAEAAAGEGALIYQPNVSGWEAFEYLDVLIVLAAVGALVAAAIGWALEWRLPFLAVTLVGGGLGVIIIFAAERPANPLAFGPTHVGYLLALLACGALLAGGIWSVTQLVLQESRKT
jgi:hypothetical protein